MPVPGPPENRSPLVGPDGKPAVNWQQWFTRIWRNLFPTDHFYIPSRQGAPTAAPEVRPGFVAMVYDETGNALYIYNGAWKSTPFT